MTSTNTPLAEGQAVSENGLVTSRLPARSPFEGLLILQHAAQRYGAVVGDKPISFAQWAKRIDADPLAQLDPDRARLTAALRDMDRRAHRPPSRARQVLTKLAAILQPPSGAPAGYSPADD